ncbi:MULTISPECIES: flagellar hook-basal body complex protein FliE [Limnobacter]|uniref:Flagellar hook-basal body complex protein FliE n=1 Tax=Limnobacter litoralis TaxID=481366 RepID=A0ABQ5YYT8_9BURK|nr:MULTISPECIES: flagellar hook-basal body complex protein FliE [Limnobacter]GLR27662.1 hypothetical protein GCM10007875_27530 [Limnobacter litoralis]HEX5485146.1 flagellar hook-basal body complex protein FliE [Limnobacter sp.]
MIDKTAMIANVMATQPTGNVGGAGAVNKGQGPEGSFTDVIGKMLENSSKASATADDFAQRLQMNDPKVSLEQTVLAMNSASLQFTAVVQTRNKVLQAYNDIMNMPV